MAYLGPSLRRRKLRERPAARAAAAFVLSVAANLLLLALLAATGVFEVRVPVEVKPVALAPMSAEQWERNRTVDGAITRAAPPKAPERAKPVPPPAPPPEQRARGQVVDVAPSADNRPPEKETRFLADRDNRVEKETRSRHGGTKLWENTLPAPSSGDPKAKVAPAPGEGGEAQNARAGREGAPPRPAAPPQKPAGERLALAPRTDGDAGIRIPSPAELLGDVPATPGRPGEPARPGDGDGGERSAGARVDLRPDAAMMARIAGGPSADHLEGVEEGEATALNTRQFRYAGYINRVALAVNQTQRVWDAYLARDGSFQMYPVRQRTTVIVITLDGAGSVEQIEVREPSGLDFVDRELVRAVRAAGPFPNPPAGLKSSDGKIRLPQAWLLDVERFRRLSAATGRP
jgi:TonB family protein